MAAPETGGLPALFRGGGGLGAIAINYGHYRQNYAVMFAMIVVLVLLVQVLQEFGTRGARLSDRRIR